jgi:crotonobetainyl-CoA:carnitine CoA-transferase CaiB-like acyl-CoA transferase
VAHPVRVGPEPPPTPRPAPTHGQHTPPLLMIHGYSDEEIERLGREGAVLGLGGRATG